MVARFTEIRYDNIGNSDSDFVEFIIPVGETDTYEVRTLSSNGNLTGTHTVGPSQLEGQVTLGGVNYNVYVVGNNDGSGFSINGNSGVALVNTTATNSNNNAVGTGVTDEFVSFGGRFRSSGSNLPSYDGDDTRPRSDNAGTAGSQGALQRQLDSSTNDLEDNFTTVSQSSATPGSVPGGAVVCLTTGALIECRSGQLVPVENLKVGDWVKTQSHGYQQLRWIGRRSVSKSALQLNPKLRPVRIAAGALGNGLPERDLTVSRQHRMLVNPWMTADQNRRDPVLIAAIKLVVLDGVEVDNLVESVEYFHLMFDQHEVIFAEGAATESLYAGPEALKCLDRWALKELTTLFPKLRDATHLPDPVARIPSNKDQKSIAQRYKTQLLESLENA